MAVVDPDVAVDVEEPQGLPPLLDAAVGQGAPELGGLPEGGKTDEFSAHGLDFWRPVEAQDAAEVLRRTLLEAFGSLDAQERHQDERDEGGAQAVVGGAGGGAGAAGAFAHAALEECGDGAAEPRVRDPVLGLEQRRRVLEQPQGREEAIHDAVHGIGVGGGGQVVCRKSGQFWVRSRRGWSGGRFRGGFRKSGQFWVRTCRGEWEIRLEWLGVGPPQSLEPFADGFLSHAQDTGDLAVGEALGLEALKAQ